MTNEAITPDKDLISRILQGNKDLYAIIVRRYNQRLYKIGMAILNDDTEVEDAMQVTYINAYENLEQFGSRAQFSTWLIRILINECNWRLKKNAKTSLLEEHSMENEIQHNQPNQASTPVTALLATELKGVLENAIRQLPEKYRVVFVMREMEDMNVAETQECLALTEANVKVRLNRAKAMLRDLLSHYYKKEEILHFHLSRCDKMVDQVMGLIQPKTVYHS